MLTIHYLLSLIPSPTRAYNSSSFQPSTRPHLNLTARQGWPSKPKTPPASFSNWSGAQSSSTPSCVDFSQSCLNTSTPFHLASNTFLMNPTRPARSALNTHCPTSFCRRTIGSIALLMTPTPSLQSTRNSSRAMGTTLALEPRGYFSVSFLDSFCPQTVLMLPLLPVTKAPVPQRVLDQWFSSSSAPVVPTMPSVPTSAGGKRRRVGELPTDLSIV